MQAWELIVIAVVIIIGVGAIIIFTRQRTRIYRWAGIGWTRIKRRTRRARVDRRTMADWRTRRTNRFRTGINAQKIIIAASGGDTAGYIKGVALIGF